MCSSDLVPVAFVSEHSETLVELDIEYAKLARETGVKDYIRVATARTHPAFVDALASLAHVALSAKSSVTCCALERICPEGRICGRAEARTHA